MTPCVLVRFVGSCCLRLEGAKGSCEVIACLEYQTARLYFPDNRRQSDKTLTTLTA